MNKDYLKGTNSFQYLPRSLASDKKPYFFILQDKTYNEKKKIQSSNKKNKIDHLFFKCKG